MLPSRNGVDSFIFNMQDKIGRNLPKISSRSFPYFPEFTFKSEFAEIRDLRFDRLELPHGSFHWQVCDETYLDKFQSVRGFNGPVKFEFGSTKVAADTKFMRGKICFGLTIQETEVDYHSWIDKFSLFTKLRRCQNQVTEESSLN